MGKSEEKTSAEELLRKIQELEAGHAHIKQQISKLTSNSISISPLPVTVTDPLSVKLTEARYLNILHSMGQAVHVFDLKHRIYFWLVYIITQSFLPVASLIDR